MNPREEKITITYSDDEPILNVVLLNNDIISIRKGDPITDDVIYAINGHINYPQSGFTNPIGKYILADRFSEIKCWWPECHFYSIVIDRNDEINNLYGYYNSCVKTLQELPNLSEDYLSEYVKGLDVILYFDVNNIDNIDKILNLNPEILVLPSNIGDNIREEFNSNFDKIIYIDFTRHINDKLISCIFAIIFRRSGIISDIIDELNIIYSFGNINSNGAFNK